MKEKIKKLYADLEEIKLVISKLTKDSEFEQYFDLYQSCYDYVGTKGEHDIDYHDIKEKYKVLFALLK